MCVPDRLEKPSFFGEKFFVGFLGLLDLSVQIGPDTKFQHMKNILYTILSLTSFSVHYWYNKTHESWLKYEIKYDLYKIW